ncbi:MAG: hypothetical protein RLY87_54 [Chloroflexota bacterium]|jgi:hypothetical protein
MEKHYTKGDPVHRITRLAVYPARFIFWLSTALFIATGSGHFYASDEEKMYATTLRIWQALRALGDASIAVERPILSVYGPMQSVVAFFTLPLGSLLSALGPAEMQAWLVRIPATWGNAVIVAATGTLLGWLVTQYTRRPGLGVAIAATYLLATPAWQYAGSFFSEPNAALWLLCAAVPVLLTSTDTTLQPKYLVLSGFACLPALLAKIAVAPTIAVIALCVGLSCLQRRDWSTLLRWGAGAFIALVVFLCYNLLARGSLLSSGYNQNQSSFAIEWGNIITGIYGQFFSSGKSIFLYAPLLVLWPIGIIMLRRDLRWSLAPFAICGAVIFIHTNVVFWHGDGAWGPRYLVLCLPFMVLPLVAVYSWLTSQSRRVRWVVLTPLLVLTVIVQTGGLAINLNAYIIDTRDEQARYHDPASSPIIGHHHMLWAQLGRDWAIATAPGVTLTGFAYSEGDRANGEQFPRFAAPQAAITVRPDNTQRSIVSLTMHTCADATHATPVTLLLDGVPIDAVASCPPRRISIVVPPGAHTLAFQTSGIRVDGLPQHDWYPTLGPLVQQVRVDSGGKALPIWANLTPPSRMPDVPNAMRVWASDSRSGFYDVWWSYLNIPASAPIWPVQLSIWGMVLLCVAIGVWPRRRVS